MMRYLICLLLFVTSCKAYQISSENFEESYVPPNGFKVSENLFIDKSEISNIDWKEYHYWLGRIFGKDSNEYGEAFPDTTIWMGESILDTLLIVKYYSSYEYDNFPVVGVTQEQAMKYSKWRTDRVFEMLLVNSGKIVPTSVDQTSDNYFSIERYFSGNFFDYEPDTTIKLVPKFSLPTSKEIEMINKEVAISNSRILENCKKKDCKNCKQKYLFVNSAANSTNNYELYKSPIKPSMIDCTNSSILEVHNLVGNVSEWTMGYLETYGGSWRDEIENNEFVVSKKDKRKSCDIGFRNISKLVPRQ